MSRAKVLVIDDEIGLLEEVVEWLQFEGYTVYSAGGGAEGIRLALEHRPDLIVCDIMMPYVDGYRVLLEVRTKPETAMIPFVFLSALAERGEIRRGMSLGADDYVTKPFARQELLDAVQARLEKHEEFRRSAARELDALRFGMSVTLPFELRTPIAGIVGFGQLLALDPAAYSPAEITHMAQQIVAHGERLLRLFDNYLAFVQLELTKEQPVVADDEMCATREGVNMAAMRLAEYYARRNDLKIELADALAAISPQFLDKLIHELLDNAFKFSVAGTPIVVRSTVEDGRLRIRISDQGRGMAVEDAQRAGAFVQFQRDKYEQQGLGLGLAIARRIVERNNGDLRISSQVNSGTTVEVSLPLYAHAPLLEMLPERSST